MVRGFLVLFYSTYCCRFEVMCEVVNPYIIIRSDGKAQTKVTNRIRLCRRKEFRVRELKE